MVGGEGGQELLAHTCLDSPPPLVLETRPDHGFCLCMYVCVRVCVCVCVCVRARSRVWVVGCCDSVFSLNL